MAEAAVEVVELTRVYEPRRKPRVVALDRVSSTIPEGEVHGLLGPNGAGKTTLVKVLSTVLLPTAGTARVCGHDVVTETRAVRPLIGIVFGGERGLYGRLTARRNLEYWAALYRLPAGEGKRRAERLLERVGLLSALPRRADDRPRPGRREGVPAPRRRAARAKAGRSSSPPTTWSRPRPSATA